MITINVEEETLHIENTMVYVDEHNKEYGELIQAVGDAYSPTYTPDYEDGLGHYIMGQLKYLKITYEVLDVQPDTGDQVY